MPFFSFVNQAVRKQFFRFHQQLTVVFLNNKRICKHQTIERQPSDTIGLSPFISVIPLHTLNLFSWHRLIGVCQFGHQPLLLQKSVVIERVAVYERVKRSEENHFETVTIAYAVAISTRLGWQN